MTTIILIPSETKQVKLLHKWLSKMSLKSVEITSKEYLE